MVKTLDSLFQKEKESVGDAASRKSSRPGKGRNPRLERDDEEVDIPKKVWDYFFLRVAKILRLAKLS
jgi:hypothetical protein